jgi:hypothetical protein
METFSMDFIFNSQALCILIKGVSFEIYKGSNKRPCYFCNGKYTYLNEPQQFKADFLISKTKNL